MFQNPTIRKLDVQQTRNSMFVFMVLLMLYIPILFFVWGHSPESTLYMDDTSDSMRYDRMKLIRLIVTRFF